MTDTFRCSWCEQQRPFVQSGDLSTNGKGVCLCRTCLDSLCAVYVNADNERLTALVQKQLEQNDQLVAMIGTMCKAHEEDWKRKAQQVVLDALTRQRDKLKAENETLRHERESK